MQKFFFIVNPKSGSHADISAVDFLRKFLRDKGKSMHLELTQSLGHAGELAKKAIGFGCHVVVVAGGDGTVRAVADAMAGSDIPIFIIPCGTENLMACEIGIDGSMERAIETLETGFVRNLDLGQANNHHFMAVIGVGFDAEVIRRVHHQRSGHITPADYIWPICRTFWEYRFPVMHVEADGQVVCNEPALVFVCNITRYAMDLRIAPDADCSDGLLDLCIYRCNNQLRLLELSVMTALRVSHKSNCVIRQKCRKIVISSPEKNVPVQLDGDPGPALPLNIEVIPHAAKLLTPPPPPGHKYHPPVRLYHLRKWMLR